MAIGLAALPAAGARPAAVAAAQCPVISGYVYHDVNNNGLRDSGEPPIAGSTIQLRSVGGTTIGNAVTNADGYYQFVTDETADPPHQTVSHSADFPETVTDWALTKSLPQFDPSLGTLRSVTITNSATITSAIKAESLDSAPATISATVSGTLTITAPGGRALAALPTVNAGSFDAAAYDGVADFAGPSGHDFGSHTANDDNSVTISDPAALAAYVGTGSVSFAGSVIASSRTSGSGNVLNRINTTASGRIDVTYTYSPVVCLPPGSYTIVQTQQPPTYTDGRETSGNVTPIPGSNTTDHITISLTNGDSPNNNFGELRASISGYVYVDADDDGVRDAGEAPIPGVTIRLTGTDSSGTTIDKTTATNSNRFYQFVSLLAGDYVIVETQPAAYLDGKDTIGSQGGNTENDRHYDIALPAGVDGVNNNFGEKLPPSPTPTGTPPDGSTPGTGTPGPSGTPGGSTVHDSTPIQTVAGDRTPGAPSAGSGFLGRATSFNVMVVGLAVFAASGWLAFLALRGRRPFSGPGE
ncbi:MAG: choice-of-anchor E domain-containing protein [Hyphomicrobiales bacterium]